MKAAQMRMIKQSNDVIREVVMGVALQGINGRNEPLVSLRH